MQNTNISKTIKILEKGGIIIYPTETCYGIGADATNQKAINKIYEMKKREKKPLIILVSSKKMAEKYIQLNKPAKLLIKLMPGPLTLIARNKNNITKPLKKNVGNGLVIYQDTIAFRISSHGFVKKLFKYWKKPLVSTSANLSGNPEPYNIKDIDKEIIKNADIVINKMSEFDKDSAINRKPKRTKPSTIFNTLTLEIVRKGPVSETLIKNTLKNKIKKILCGGCFNHIHKGHIYFLKKSKSLGDHLTVVISNNTRNEKKYGTEAIDATERKKAIEKLGIADKVIIGHNGNILKTLKKEQPNIISLGYDQPELPKHIKKKYKILRINKL
ncbi:MAG: L-threonylcarbamoyladenylate synthase [Candidatus Aenigmatarchaeota archaeon]